MGIIQQQSVWGKLDDKWKIMRVESETTWRQLRNKEQHGTNWRTRSIWHESSASRSESLNKYLEWCTVTCDRLSAVTQCQKQHKWPIMKEFGDLYKFDQWICTQIIFTVQNKWDRWGFQPGTNIALAIFAVSANTTPPPPSVAILFIYRTIRNKNTIRKMRLYKFIRVTYKTVFFQAWHLRSWRERKKNWTDRD